MLKQHLAAIAIVLDFVNPVMAFRGMIDRGGKLWLNETEPRVYQRYIRWGLCSPLIWLAVVNDLAERGTMFLQIMGQHHPSSGKLSEIIPSY